MAKISNVRCEHPKEPCHLICPSCAEHSERRMKLFLDEPMTLVNATCCFCRKPSPSLRWMTFVDESQGQLRKELDGQD